MFHLDREMISQYENDIVNLLDYIINNKNQSVKKYYELKNIYIDSNETYCFGHIKDNILVSFIWFFKRNFNNSDRLHISYISTNTSFRGQGLAMQLLLKVDEIAKINNISYVDLNVSPDNIEAIALYNKCNFSKEKILMKKLIDLE